MKSLQLIAQAIICILVLSIAQACRAAAPNVTAFVHVNVVPMDRERLLRDQTVIIRNGIIAAVGRNLVVPAGTNVIDGHGKFLSPGLADMHTHSESREDMKVYLANGVTTVLNLGGASSDFIDQRVPLLNRGERPGPHVYAAFRIDGTSEYGQFVVKTPEEARWAVRLAKTNGHRFIKVYNNLSPDAFAAAADEARKQGLGLAAHHLEAVPLDTEVQGGDFLIAHLEEVMYGLFTPPLDDPLAPPTDAAISNAVDLLTRNRAFVVADLVTFQTIAQQWGRPDVVAGYLAEPQAKYVPFQWRLDWRRDDYDKRTGSLARRAAFLARLVKALNDAGIPILAGTDAPTIPGVVPGFSLHDDLDRLVDAGFTRFQAFSTATRLPGEFINRSIHDAPPFGKVQQGYRADLILSDANPLDDLGALRTPVGVMGHGRWYDRRELQGMLDSVAADYSAAAILSR